MLRILMLVPFPGVRGPVAKHTPLLVNALRELGCEVVTEPWGRHRDDESLASKFSGRARDIIRIRRRLVAEPFDVLVVKTSHEWPSLMRDIPLLAATRQAVPSIVLQFHGGRSDRLVTPGDRGFKLASSALFRLSDGVLVLSSEEQKESLQFWPRGRFHVVANPFDLSAVNNSETKIRHDRQGPMTLLFAGRLMAEKGIFDSLSALSLLRDRMPCRLLIAGTGPDEQNVAERARELGLADDLVLAGHLSSDELLRAYRAADVFVFPTYWFEGFPTVLSEAMAAGLPIVTTRTRGIADHLQDGVNALFVPPREPTVLAQTLERLLGDAELRRQMSLANREKVREFAPDRVASRYLTALEEILGSRTRAVSDARRAPLTRSPEEP
jgi:glycosyltransferase involved in cell wall biosynthesis